LEIFSFITFGGTIAFAASGALAGIRKNLDIFGVAVIAFVTSVGGGTLRDILLGQFPVKWLLDTKIVLLIVSIAVLTVVFKNRIIKLDKTLVFFDTLGLGFFTIKGIEVGVDAGILWPSCIILGTITACFGGVIRDIILNEIPTLFRKEIYATACIVGGFLYFFLQEFNILSGYKEIVVFTVIVVIRFLAIRMNISLPNIGE
jgi:uncharacterized membrane protein YeiH